MEKKYKTIKIAKFVADKEMLPTIIEAEIIEERENAINIKTKDNRYAWLGRKIFRVIKWTIITPKPL